jgi:hypothetical protein
MSWLARLLRRRQSIPDAPPLREDFFENPPERFGVSRKVYDALLDERDALKEQVAELEAENKRLREALEGEA